jgi:hypothetical protein
MSTNLWLGAALIALGFISLWRAFSGEKASAVVTLNRSTDGLMSKRDRLIAVMIGTLNVLLGLVNLWTGLRHR